MFHPSLGKLPRDTADSIGGRCKTRMMESLLRRCPTIPPPKQGKDYNQTRGSEQIESFDVLLKMLPVPSEQITRAGDHRHPDKRSEKIEDEKLAPRHAKDSGEGSGNDPHSEHKPGEEDCNGAVTVEQALALC